MELYAEILAKALEGGSVKVEFPVGTPRVETLVEMRSYAALKQIKEIIEDESLEDPACFIKMEEVIAVFEALGSNGGNRHDFDG
jgi:hypothetical protein